MPRSRTIILMYHRIARVRLDPWSMCVSPEHFAEHLQVLQKYHRVPLEHLKPGGGWSLRGKLSVAITFDDGYADNLFDGARLLKRYDTPATFFITTGYIGGDREFWWDEVEQLVPTAEFLTHYEILQPLTHQARRTILDQMWTTSGRSRLCRSLYLPMTHEELRRLAADGLFEIGAHTVTHPLLAAQTEEQQNAEIANSKIWLEEFLNRPVTSFSYPYGGKGHYNDFSVSAVRNAGYSRACTTESCAIARRDNSCEWARIQVPDLDGDAFSKFLFA
jgi:peptidoglycan/xylan/chitin deacetylase (PgdA/CDA1 family)